MKPFSPAIVPALAAFMLTGCVYDHERIVLLSEPTAGLHPVEPTPKLAPSLSMAELAQVEQQVFTRLLQGHFGDNGDYSAIFLQASERQTTDLMKRFPEHNPPLKQLWHSDIRPGFAPMDKDTGRPAMIFSVEEMDPENNQVTAIGRWYAGDAVKGFYTYTLTKTAGSWIIPATE